MSARDPHRALLRALVARHPDLLILDSRHEPWASATFTGARHCLTCATGPYLAGIEDAEFALAGHIVADLAVEHHDGQVVIEALTIECA
jgi:hypothetical protein